MKSGIQKWLLELPALHQVIGVELNSKDKEAVLTTEDLSALAAIPTLERIAFKRGLNPKSVDLKVLGKVKAIATTKLLEIDASER